MSWVTFAMVEFQFGTKFKFTCFRFVDNADRFHIIGRFSSSSSSSNVHALRLIEKYLLIQTREHTIIREIPKRDFRNRSQFYENCLGILPFLVRTLIVLRNKWTHFFFASCECFTTVLCCYRNFYSASTFMNVIVTCCIAFNQASSIHELIIEIEKWREREREIKSHNWNEQMLKSSVE